MLAIDTNVLVRYLARDDPEQWPRAHALIVGQDVYVATTVILEAEWVLRSGLGFSAGEIVEAFRAFGGISTITLEDPARLADALDWTEAGMDFADALHLAAAKGCKGFVSFDRRLARTAAALNGLEIREP
jgi:predicted nucleic-acid-binding protein